MPSLALAILTGFVHKVWLGLAVALGIALLFTLLHILRSCWWLWMLALANFAIAYFALFQLDFIARGSHLLWISTDRHCDPLPAVRPAAEKGLAG